MNTEQVIKLFVESYNKETQFLKDFKLEKEKGTGSFVINSDFYMQSNTPLHYLSAVEMIICLNQMLYVHLAHIGLISIDENREPNLDYMHELIYNKYIISQSYKFQKKIDVTNGTTGSIEVISSKKIKEQRLVICKYSFDNKCFGEVKIMLRD